MGKVIIDVRERDEFNAEHVENSINVPLSEFNSMAPGVVNNLKDRELVIMCRSGKRAGLACDILQKMDVSELKYDRFNGGIIEWKNQGKNTVAAAASHMPILRQVQLIGGSMALVGALLGLLVNPMFSILALMVGAGMIHAGASGNCAMATWLQHAPWNKSHENLKEEVCVAKTGQPNCVK